MRNVHDAAQISQTLRADVAHEQHGPIIPPPALTADLLIGGYRTRAVVLPPGIELIPPADAAPAGETTYHHLGNGWHLALVEIAETHAAVAARMSPRMGALYLAAVECETAAA